MLQQTTVQVVGGYYEKFLARFPDVTALASAPEEAVMVAWAGLGYYARARNLHECAKQVAALGGFPDTVEGLRALPGIGPYTADAIAAIAFNRPAVAVDGNVERVVSRLFLITNPLPGSKPEMRAAAERLGLDKAARERPSDFLQALFDLGATICTPSRPACALCPWRAGCAARKAGMAEELPRKAPKVARPSRFGAVFWLEDAAGRVLLRRRPAKGLLGGMAELPGTEWGPEPIAAAEALGAAPLDAKWRRAGEVRHVFTHFSLTLDVFAARVADLGVLARGGAYAARISGLDEEALPSLMRKCVLMAVGGVEPGAGKARVVSGGRKRRAV